MSTSPSAPSRAEVLAQQRQFELHRNTDRLFALLMGLQWIGGVTLALLVSPRAWAGSSSSVHLHLWLAIILGGALSSLPIFLALRHPGTATTRQVIAVAQALWSGLLIHLTGGRIETHFHVFGSLAFLAIYRDYRVLVTASAIVAVDHAVRNVLLPQSLFGVLAPNGWRWLEHAGWVVFEAVVLVYSCVRGRRELFENAAGQALVERFAETIEQQVKVRTSELAKAHDELLEAGESLRAMHKAMPGALLVFDQEGTVLAVNEGTRELLGYTEDELVGHPMARLFSVQDVPRQEELDESGAGALRVEKACRAKDGSLIPVLFSARALVHGDGSRRDSVCVLLDLRERKQLELQLRQNQKLESLGHLAAGIAHEINTPTQFVSDNTRFLQSSFAELSPLLEACARLSQLDRDTATMERAMDELIDQASRVDLAFAREEIPRAIDDTLGGLGRISGIVLAMKEFSHPGARNRELADINRAIQSTVVVARNEWKYVARLETELAPGLPRVSCFPQDINQVLLVMIVNAAQAIDEARKRRKTDELGLIRIVTRVTQVGGSEHLEIRISDDGCGIPEAIRGRIFDQFFTTKEVGKGTGQGLAIAHNAVVVKHGGRIEVESEEGKGTCFVVQLPLEAAPVLEAA